MYIWEREGWTLIGDSPLTDVNQPTPYTFQLGDENSIITYNNVNDGEYLIPLESSQAFNIGDIITIDASLNTGDVMINGVSGVTFETAGTDTYNKVLNIKKVGSDSWRSIGNYKEVYNQGTAPTINGTPAALADFEMPFRSSTSSFGFPKDSTK